MTLCHRHGRWGCDCEDDRPSQFLPFAVAGLVFAIFLGWLFLASLPE